jgi:hypothetical protein
MEKGALRRLGSSGRCDLSGIAGRVRDGTAASEHAAERAGMVPPLAEKAWEFASAAERV